MVSSHSEWTLEHLDLQDYCKHWNTTEFTKKKRKKIPTCSQSEVSSDLDPTYSGLSPDKAVNIKLSQWIYHRVHAPSFYLHKKLSEQSKISKNNKNLNKIIVSASLIKLGIKLILPCTTATQLYQRCGSSINKNGNQSWSYMTKFFITL